MTQVLYLDSSGWHFPCVFRRQKQFYLLKTAHCFSSLLNTTCYRLNDIFYSNTSRVSWIETNDWVRSPVLTIDINQKRWRTREISDRKAVRVTCPLTKFHIGTFLSITVFWECGVEHCVLQRVDIRGFALASFYEKPPTVFFFHFTDVAFCQLKGKYWILNVDSKLH